jgi:RNA polymerase sigma-70 factor (ECF subfamily)
MSADLIARAANGDDTAFAALTEPHRNALRLHCYRMSGSFEDAEDLVQETLVRAWRNLRSFEHRSSFPTWLYSLATNATLDFLRKIQRRATFYPESRRHGLAGESLPRIAWLQPLPDALLDTRPADTPDPGAEIVERETIELVFIVALQFLPPQQRAVLILRDVLGFTAADTAAQLRISTQAANSTLQRARATLRRHLPSHRAEWRRDGEFQQQDMLHRYMQAASNGDIEGMLAMLHPDAKLTMPPLDVWFAGREAIIDLARSAIDPASPRYFGEWRYLPFRANWQPAAAAYVRPAGETTFRPQVLDVLRIDDGVIVEITSFSNHLFPLFGLPDALDR